LSVVFLHSSCAELDDGRSLCEGFRSPFSDCFPFLRVATFGGLALAVDLAGEPRCECCLDERTGEGFRIFFQGERTRERGGERDRLLERTCPYAEEPVRKRVFKGERWREFERARERERE
jgi:hypothetical protein